MPDKYYDPIFTYQFTIPPETIDENGHVNNVYYLQWMQDMAVRHYQALGGIPVTEELGATWVVRAHRIEYINPAFLGDEILMRTWIANLRRVRSLRRYDFIRRKDNQILVRGETDWVFMDTASGRPLAIPTQISKLFSFVPDEK
ncbi:MAG: acyl-CoA thioesterase [Anaerolineales bacterium]|nr:acyl-CoA thioesterase [Anaerolineales bacterium]